MPSDSAPSSLQLATVTGWRVIRDAKDGKPALAIDRPFNCSESTDGLPTTVCLLSGSPVQETTPGKTPTADDIPLSTLALTNGPDVSARAGSVATIKFRSRATGAARHRHHPDAGDHHAPRRPARVPAEHHPRASQLPSEVRVRVPLAANTGDYTVTLQTANGLRKASANLRVTGIRTLIGPQITAP